MPALTVELRDSRRLTGPNLLSDGPGAAIDCTLRGVSVDAFLNAWRTHVRDALYAVGWGDQYTVERRFEGGATVFHSALSLI